MCAVHISTVKLTAQSDINPKLPIQFKKILKIFTTFFENTLRGYVTIALHYNELQIYNNCSVRRCNFSVIMKWGCNTIFRVILFMVHYRINWLSADYYDWQPRNDAVTDTNLTPKFVIFFFTMYEINTRLVPCDNPPAPCLSNFWPMNVVFSFYQSHPLNLNIFMANCFRSATCREYVVNMFLW